MIKKIRLQGLLSFEDMELELRNLNVLIGPNGSGKSNLIEALSLLQALPTDIGEPIRRGGGIDEWICKSTRVERAGGSVTVELPLIIERESQHVQYDLSIARSKGVYEVQHESITSSPGLKVPDGSRRTRVFASSAAGQESILGPLTPPFDRPVFEYQAALRVAFNSIGLYRGWTFGNNAPAREAQPADQPVDRLAGDASNLALVVANMPNVQDVEQEFRRFFDRFRRFTVQVFANKVLLSMHEEGLEQPIPATRWSDGMIRYLCLLAILCHPNPPGLICIDEPDLGFHPDVLPNLARLIKEASEKTQIIITTHSAELVDHFSDDPGSVVVCERDFDGATQMKRQDPKRLKKWLEDYSLGELWRSGEIGGNPL